jgi:hypothetical protein
MLPTVAVLGTDAANVHRDERAGGEVLKIQRQRFERWRQSRPKEPWVHTFVGNHYYQLSVLTELVIMITSTNQPHPAFIVVAL